MELPEVSLISSWHSPTPKQARTKPDLLALRLGLEQQLALHDLYFLNHTDIPWYQKALKKRREARREVNPGVADAPGPAESSELQSPLAFAAALSAEDVKTLAEALIEFLAENFKGRLVGPRPRFTALATYWPLISLPAAGDENKETLRQQSVAALANSLRLAEQLGCHYVEIVAGSAVPESVQKSQADLSEARRERTQALCQSLREVFEQTEPTGGAAAGRLPSLCLEIEPGEVYLMDQVSRFAELRKELAKDTSFRWLDRVLLNIDLAHMMLTQGDEARSGSEVQEAAARQPDVMPWIGHMHMSDHARTHAADLCPGTYHFYPDYKPWLELAIELCQQKHNRFSGVVAVELEACGDIFEVVRAVGKTRRWIAHTARRFLSGENGHSPRLLEGALLVVDIGNSTACMTDKAPELIEGCVTRICQTVHRHRGSVYSFTGDGVIALFDMAHFSSRKEAADYSWQVVEALPGAVASFMDGEEPDSPYLRAALHWGHEVRVPTGGSLRYQAIGREVVVACRLCGCADDDLRKTKHPKMNVIASADWLNAKGEKRPCKPRDLKGITQRLDAAAWKWTPEGQ